MHSVSDEEIIARFFDRDQQAIAHTQQKYGGLCRKIANGILGNREDAEECLNDALLKLWDSIPPAKPKSLIAYLSVAVRNLACNRRAAERAEKRGGGAFAEALSEFENVLAAPENPERVIDTIALGDAVNRFLSGLKAEQRAMFVMRYWSNLSIKEIAEKCCVSQSKVKMTLLRLRKELGALLAEEELL